MAAESKIEMLEVHSVVERDYVTSVVAPVTDARVRMNWLDGAKGLGIVMVVYGHAARALYADTAAPLWAQTADRLIYAFHMPLFFVIAGLFVWPSLGKGRQRFLTDKLITVAYPYILWSLIEGVLELVFAGEVNSPISPFQLEMIPFLPIEQYWFLYVLGLSLLLALVCYPWRAAVLVVAVAGLAVVDIYGSGSMALRTLAYFPYVATGILIAAPILALGSGTPRAVAALVLSSIVFAVGIALGWHGAAATFIIALAGSGTTLAAASLLDRSIFGASLALLGRASLAIYVMHTIFSAGLRIGLRTVGVVIPSSSMLIATVVAGITGPLVVWLLAERHGVSTLAGLGRQTRRRGTGRGLFDRPAERATIH